MLRCVVFILSIKSKRVFYFIRIHRFITLMFLANAETEPCWLTGHAADNDTVMTLLSTVILYLNKNELDWSKVTVKTFIMIQKIDFQNKCWSFELSIHLWILKNEIYQFLQKHSAVRLFSTLIIIRNVCWAVYYYDFWRSCDTKDWWKYSCASYIHIKDSYLKLQ